MTVLSRSGFLVMLILAAFMLGCGIHSKFKTRSFMSDEEVQNIEDIYNPPVEDVDIVEREILPFLEGFEGPAMIVNGFEVDAADIRELYEYMASYRLQDVEYLKRNAAVSLISAYAVMSQWPDTVDTTVETLNDLKNQVMNGADFSYLVVENSQEPGAEEFAGDLGEISRDHQLGLDPIFEMHAFTEPVGEVVGPFPTPFGWHLMQVISRDDDADPPVTNPRHLLLFHGLDAANSTQIMDQMDLWTMNASVEVIAGELQEVLSDYAQRFASEQAAAREGQID